MNILSKIIASFFDKFKTKNPKLAAVILLILGSIIYWTENGLSEIIGTDLSQLVHWVSIILGLLTGVHTSEILKKEKE